MTPPGAPQGKGGPAKSGLLSEALPDLCLTVPTLFQGPGDFALATRSRPLFSAETPQGQILLDALTLPHRSPFYISAFFRSSTDPSSPYLFKTDLFPQLPRVANLQASPLDIESSRYPLIHDLSLKLREVENIFSEIKQKEATLDASVKKLTEYALKRSDQRGPEADKAIAVERRKIKRTLQEIRTLLDSLDAPIKSLEQWGLQDGKDKAVSREAALDMVFRLYRANEVVAKNLPSTEIDPSYDFLRRTQDRLYQQSASEGLSFGVAVVDLNLTGANAVNRDLGEIILEEAYPGLKEHFQGSTVSKGTRTNFRIVNPDGKLLSQAQLLKLEADIHQRIAKRVAATGNKEWIRFVEDYKVGLSAGYSEVKFHPDEVQVGGNGEYTMDSVNALLKKVDYSFRVAAARSQEITVRLKEEEAQKNASKAERLHFGQMAISDLNGIPEDRFFEPGEAETAKRAPVRLVHNIQGLNGVLKPYRTFLNNVERFSEDPTGRPEMVREVLVGLHGATTLIDDVGQQYYSIAYDVSHDLRMPRLVERPFAAERVDTVIRETGGAHLLFVELGQFYSFVRSWHGGNDDVYVHDLIYQFNKVLVQKGLVLMHPANQAPLLDDKGRIAVDPKWGQYFQLTGQHEDSASGIKILRTNGTAFPVGSEVVLAMRDGDELGFVVGARKADGSPVLKEDLQAVFREWDELIRKNFGHMFMDDIQKVGKEKIRTPSWQLLEWQNGKVGKHVIAEKSHLAQEADAVADFTGWVVDYESVKNAPAPGSDPSMEASDAVVGRRVRWRYFQDGEVTNKAFTGDVISVAEKNAVIPSLDFPKELTATVPELMHQPILAKIQTRLSAGFVSVDLRSGAELDKAWKVANDTSKKSKEKGGEPLFLGSIPAAGTKPQGHEFDKTVSRARTLEVSQYFQDYAKPGTPDAGKSLSPELKKFLGKNGQELGRLIDPLRPKTFERQLLRLVKDQVSDPNLQKRLLLEIDGQLKEGGSLIRARDGIAAAQIMKRDGLSVDYQWVGPALWTALEAGEKALGEGKATEALRASKADFVRRYVQQTGQMPPEGIAAEGRKYVDPRSVFIPEEIFSLAKSYNVAPERVPFLVAGLKADEIRKLGQEAFSKLTYEDLKKLADSPDGQAFLNNPKNAILLQDTLSSRMAFQGVPLATSMAMVFPSEMLCKYLSEKIGAARGLTQAEIEEMKFGMTLYMVHSLNITASGAWEVLATRSLSARALVRSEGAEGMKSLAEILKMRLNGGILQGSKLAGQELVEVGVKTGGSLSSAMWEGVLEKWGWRSAAGAFSWKAAAWSFSSGLVRVPLNMLRTMGPGYLSATLYDRVAGIWLKPDNPVRKWGSFVAFFAPDLLRLGLGSSRIAASPFLKGAGSLFTKVGNRLLAISILNYGIKRLVVDDDYQTWVNRRVTDQVYDKYVYSLKPYDWYEMPLAAPIAGIRASARFLAPDAIEWAVGGDHSDIRSQILAEDMANSVKITQGLDDLLPKLMALPSFYQVSEAASYTKLDFSALETKVTLTPKEEELLKKMGQTDSELPDEAFAGMDASQKDSALLRIQLHQIQQGGSYLVAVHQKENLWARDFFNDDGTLIAGKGEALMEKLHPAKPGEPSQVERVLTSRKVMVALAQLDGKTQYLGQDMRVLSRIAGVTDDNNKYVLSPAIYAALTLYTAQAYQSKEQASLDRVQELIGKLQVAYLKADEKDRSKYLEALRCLGVEP